MVFVQMLMGLGTAAAGFLYLWIGWKIGESLGRLWDPKNKPVLPVTPLALLFYPTHVAYWLAVDSRRPFQELSAPHNAGDWGLGIPFDVRCCLYERFAGHPYDLRIPSWKHGDYLVGTFVVHHSILWGAYLAAAIIRWPIVPLVYLWYALRRRTILAVNGRA